MIQFPAARRLATNGIELAVHVQGEGPPVLFCHGFPAIAYSLHHQFDAVVQAGFQAIAPDQRGNGWSDCPAGVEAYDLIHLTDDLLGLMDSLGLEKVILCGHDWGGGVAWRLVQRYPDRVLGMVSLGIPYGSRSLQDPIAMRRAQFTPDNYVLRFQEPGFAEAILQKDIGRSVDFMMRKNFMTLAAFPTADKVITDFQLLKELQQPSWPGEPIFDAEERELFIAAFTRTGYEAPINWYRNISKNWRDGADLPVPIPVPCLMLSGEDDYFAPPAYAAIMDAVIPDLERAVVPGGHWFPLEHPQAVNAIVTDWLRRRFGRT